MFRRLKPRCPAERRMGNRPRLPIRMLGRTIYVVLAAVLVVSLAIGFIGLSAAEDPISVFGAPSFGAQEQGPQ